MKPLIMFFAVAASWVIASYGRDTITPCSLHPVYVSNFDNCGAVVPKNDTTNMPAIRFLRGLLGLKYTLLMTDPDVPAAACDDFAWVKHWLVSNISSCALKRGATNLELVPGAVVYQQYTPPGPLMGFHRYQFIIFEEPFGRRVTDTQPGVQAPFNITQFVLTNFLRAVGSWEYQVDSTKPVNCSKARLEEIRQLFNIVLPTTPQPSIV